MRIAPPCKGCTARRPGCHGVCLYYRAFREQLDRQAEARQREHRLMDYITEAQERRSKRRTEK